MTQSSDLPQPVDRQQKGGVLALAAALAVPVLVLHPAGVVG